MLDYLISNILNELRRSIGDVFSSKLHPPRIVKQVITEKTSMNWNSSNESFQNVTVPLIFLRKNVFVDPYRLIRFEIREKYNGHNKLQSPKEIHPRISPYRKGDKYFYLFELAFQYPLFEKVDPESVLHRHKSLKQIYRKKRTEIFWTTYFSVYFYL